MKSKVAGIVLILGSLYYLIAEAISATFFNASLINTYVFRAGNSICQFTIIHVNEFRIHINWFNSAFR